MKQPIVYTYWQEKLRGIKYALGAFYGNWQIQGHLNANIEDALRSRRFASLDFLRCKRLNRFLSKTNVPWVFEYKKPHATSAKEIGARYETCGKWQRKMDKQYFG